MKLAFPEIDHVFDTELSKVNTLVIENPCFLYRILTELNEQIQGNEGRFVVSSDGKILDIAKNIDLISQFVPFTLNQKALLNKIANALEKNAIASDNYVRTMELMGELEVFLSDLAFDLVGDIQFSRLDIGQVIKAVGPELNMDYPSLGEKIIDYMELVTEYEREKVFVLYNLRSIMSDDEVQLFMQTVLSHNFHVLLIESCEHKRLDEEYRVIVDNDLCEIL